MRAPHYLKPNHGNEMPWEAVWIDTETKQVPSGPDEVRHQLWFGWVAYRRRTRGMKWTQPEWYRFETAEGLWSWVESKQHGKSRLYAFAHNAGFDMPVVDAFGVLPRHGFKLIKAVIQSPPVILKWRRDKQTIECIDTLNLWRVPLEELGKKVGLEKLTMPERGGTRETWDIYCRRDVEVIMEACIAWWKFLASNDLGGFAPTLAAQALRTYRHRFMRHQVFIDDDARACELSRQSYHGGRVECYRLGRIEGPLYLYDINSMYPSVMRTEPMPVKLVSHTSRASVRDLASWCEDFCVIAEVTLATEQPVWPVVHGKRLVFPVGRFTATLATPELVRALALGVVKSCNRAAVYERAVIFEEYVDTCWRERQACESAGDKMTATLWKNLSTSLYGKFGQNGRVYAEAGDAPDDRARNWHEVDADTGKVLQCRSLGGLLQRFVEEGESRDSMPAIASHVTSAGRLVYWDLKALAGHENAFYGDTDSLLVNREGSERLAHLVDPHTLGRLKLELEMPEAEIWGAKDYLFGTRWKTKGVRKGAAWTDRNTVVQEQWTTLVGLVRLGDLTAPRTKYVKKALSRAYTKGETLPDGSVLPLRLGAR